MPRKFFGVMLAVLGLAIIVEKVPVFVWWCLLGLVLVVAGWRIFTD